jgi:hypothetical protein
LSPTRITIDRNLKGIAMRLSIPVEAYRGVCVALKPARSGGFFYEIRLAHRDDELSVTLGEAPDDREIWSDWRAWAGFFGLPALVERNDGPEPWAPKAGPARPQALRRRIRRRRRPGIVTRRARREGPAIVHREREIIART